jgi:hypothetical protein
MSNIPIVQGVAVPSEQSKFGYQPAPGAAANDNNNNNFGYQQAPSNNNDYSYATADLIERRQNPVQQYNDVGFAVAFLLHLVAMIGVLSYNILTSTESSSSGSYANIVFVVGVTGLVAVGLSTLALSFMLKHSTVLVKASLVFSVVTSLAVGIIGFMVGSLMMGILGLVSFAVGICYAKMVWSRIPFAAANLNTALAAVQQNMGLAVVAYGFLGIAFAWSIFWFLGLSDALAGSNLPVVFVCFLSYYWVHQVLQNTLKVSVAGVVGTWWHIPDEASTFWSPALTGSLSRATSYSFGSICFGSLLVAIIQALRALEHYTRDNDEMSALQCIIQCILSCLESIVEYMNKWAYIYVGLYGFSYLEAGRNVIQLFQQKGWTAIITDDLTDNVLFMMSAAVGLACGVIGLLLGFVDVDMFADMGYEHASGPAFLIGMLVGFLLSSILFAVVGSAVNTVIVCYAEAPAEFQMNHPQLATEMRSAWVQAWPELSI